MELALSCGWLATVAWLILRAFSQRNLLPPVRPTSLPAADAPIVSVIVPARDEAANIGLCLQGLIAQTYPAGRLHLAVVDDHSADPTARIVQAAADRHPHLRLLRSPALPPHWIGKSHACWTGARAVPDNTEWLCFIDADVRPEPALLGSAVAAATCERLDLLSLAPRQQLESFAERLVIPCGLFVLAFRQDLRKVQSARSEQVSATGQFMLVRRRIYETTGGHAAIRSAICEDLELARLVKRAGGHVVLRDGSRLVSARMYTGWRTLWPGFAKNLVEMLGGPAATVTTALVGIVLSWAAVLVPVADVMGCAREAGGACVALLPALAASAAALGLHVAGASYFRIPLWYGLLFPLGYTAGALIAIDSISRRWRRRVSWKGRTYP